MSKKRDAEIREETLKDLDYYKGQEVCVIMWGEEDVIARAKELYETCTHKQAKEVIRRIKRNHDCNNGISWETLDIALDDVKAEDF